MENIKAIAFYLPQYHPIKENDEWWGKGFTEWTNVGKAKKYFSNHYQPRVPKDLGYYDLRVAETREAQAQLAKEYGVDGFCYWHYWFGNGKQLLDRPLKEVIASKHPDFPICLGWANESWKGFEHGLKNRNVLIEQNYPGEEDFEAHFYSLLEVFKDERYIKVNGKLLFLIYRPFDHRSIKDFLQIWRALAKKNNLGDFYFVGHINAVESSFEEVLNLGFDAVNTVRILDFLKSQTSILAKVFNHTQKVFVKRPDVYSYRHAAKFFFNDQIDVHENVIPSIVTGWDHTPRSGVEGLVLTDYTPESFKNHLEKTFSQVSNKNNKLVFIKSWNEWAEGNYLEPDLKYDHHFLKMFKELKTKFLNKN